MPVDQKLTSNLVYVAATRVRRIKYTWVREMIKQRPDGNGTVVTASVAVTLVCLSPRYQIFGKVVSYVPGSRWSDAGRREATLCMAQL